jgi:alkanesulfonate monooxygenase SsuD/methylene tetrahydromethanopterin reductase-like flavin-dependent oxidoreductase (luciferase family)
VGVDPLTRKPIHLAALWTDPSAGSRIEFDSFVYLARTAERGLFDFCLLAEPDTFTVLAASAGVTERIGLAGTIDTTFNEPFEVARQFATLDHLSGGRAGWNIVTPSDADRYSRAEEFLTVAREFWDSWDADAVLADVESGTYVDPSGIRAVEHQGPQFQVRGFATLPAGPQGHPVLLQAGDSAEGRAFGARHADVLFTRHSSLKDGQRYYADVKARARSHGRDPNQPKVLLAAPQFAGTAAQIADEIDRYVQAHACGGFILAPHGLDEFVDTVVPLLQDRGAFRTEYAGATLREHLELT